MSGAPSHTRNSQMGLRRRYLPHPHASFRSRHSQRVPVAVQLRGVKSHSRPRLRSWIQDLLHVRHDQHRWNGDLLAVSLISLPIGEKCAKTNTLLPRCVQFDPRDEGPQSGRDGHHLRRGAGGEAQRRHCSAGARCVCSSLLTRALLTSHMQLWTWATRGRSSRRDTRPRLHFRLCDVAPPRTLLHRVSTEMVGGHAYASTYKMCTPVPWMFPYVLRF